MPVLTGDDFLDIESKIRKIKAIINDPSAGKGEKDAAKHLLERLQCKYDIINDESDENKKKWFEIKCSNDYEKSLLIRLLDSYKLKPHLKKKHSKNLILFYTNQSYFEVISAELAYHYTVLSKYLKSVTINYLHKFILPYEIPESRESNSDKLTNEAAEAAAMIFAGKNYTVKKMLE